MIRILASIIKIAKYISSSYELTGLVGGDEGGLDGGEVGGLVGFFEGDSDGD